MTISTEREGGLRSITVETTPMNMLKKLEVTGMKNMMEKIM